MRTLTLFLATAILLITGGATSPTIAAAPSFDCSNATTEIERTICASPELAMEDMAMSRLFAAARIDLFGSGPSGQVAAQRKWLLERRECEAFDKRAYKNRADCLTDRYRARNLELAVGAVSRDRAFALATIRRLDPENAPLIEAAVAFADQPANSQWSSPSLAAPRLAVVKLLEAPFAKLLANGNAGFGLSILEDDGITKLDHLFASDDKFARGIGVLAAYTEGAATPTTLPCSAILKNPALTGAEGPMFGSTIDNFLPVSDCDTAMPSLPALDRLVSAIWKGWPDCEGTIRFAAYRSFAGDVEAARLGLVSPAVSRSKAMRRLSGITPAMASATVAELAAHYRKHLGMSATKAQAVATARVHSLMSSARQCGG
jgi:uncharacterized protein